MRQQCVATEEMIAKGSRDGAGMVQRGEHSPPTKTQSIPRLGVIQHMG